MGQLGGDDLAALCIDGQVQLAPGSIPRRFSQVTDVDPQPGAVDEKVQRPMGGRLEVDLTQRLQTPGQRRVIGDRQVHVQQRHQGMQETLGLTQRQVKDHADRQRRLDGNVRIPSLTAGLAGGRRSPGIQSFIGEPDREITSPSEARLVRSPVPHPISRLRILILTALRMLHRSLAPC
jgi:hypothetical protein